VPNVDFPELQSTNGSFLFEVDGVEIGTFKQVQGLQVTIDVETVNEGGQNGFEHKLPGRMQWPNIVLRRGVTKGDNLFEWLREVSGEGFGLNDNKLERSTAAIVALSSTQERLRSWNLEGAFPVRWSGPEFAATAFDNVPEEELEIAHHGFRSETHVS
jgi:phage tail-like protein